MDIENSFYAYLASYDLAIVNDYYYLFSEIDNMFLEYNMKSCQSSLYSLSEDNKEDLILKMIPFKSEILLVPFNASNIYIYNTQKKNLKIVENLLSDEEKRVDGKFIGGGYYNNKIFLIGFNLWCIYIFNPEAIGTDRYKKIHFQEISDLGNRKMSSIYCVWDNKIYILTLDFRKMLVVSLDDYSTSVVSLQDYAILPDDSFIGFVENELWTIDKYGLERHFFLGEMKLKESVKIENWQNKRFTKVFFINDRIFYIDSEEGTIWFREKKENNVIKIDMSINDKIIRNKTEGEHRFILTLKDRDSVVWINRFSGNIYRLNVETFSVEKITPIFDEEVRKNFEYIRLNQAKNTLVKELKLELEWFDLSDFLNVIEG